MGEKLSKKSIYTMIGVGLLFTVLLFFSVIQPSIQGYAIYQDVKKSDQPLEDYSKSIAELRSELLVSNTNLSSCTEFNKKLLSELEKCSDKFSECTGNFGSLETDCFLSKESYENNVADLKAELEDKNTEIETIKDQTQDELDVLTIRYDALAWNTAHNLCCKQKVDNPSIRYYIVENNKVLCLEQGTLEIDC